MSNLQKFTKKHPLLAAALVILALTAVVVPVTLIFGERSGATLLSGFALALSLRSLRASERREQAKQERAQASR